MLIAKNAVYNIKDYGATAGLSAKSTGAVQAAIDACASAGGGCVYCPPGDFLIGSIFLRDNIIFYVDSGCTIWASTDLADYIPLEDNHPMLRCLIGAKGCKNITIAGLGTVQGQGEKFWEKSEKSTLPDNEYQLGAERAGWGEPLQHGWLAKERYSKMVCFYDCKNCHIENISLLNAAGWCMHLCGCEDVKVTGVTIDAPLYGPNTDGIDIDSCTRVVVSDCNIRTGDDAIVLKSVGFHEEKRLCKDIAVTNCCLTTPCNAFKLGTESIVGFQNISFTNSVISNENAGPGWKSLGGIVIESTDGGVNKNIVVSNIAMINVHAPIFIYLGSRGRVHRGEKLPESFTPGSIENVYINNISAVGADITSSISGVPGYAITNVNLSNISIDYDGGLTESFPVDAVPERPKVYPETTIYKKGVAGALYCRHVKDLNISQMRLRAVERDARYPLIFDDVNGLDLSGIRTDVSKLDKSVVYTRGCSNINVYGCRTEISLESAQ